MRAIGRFLVLLVLAFTLVACGGSSGKPKDKTAPVITLTGDDPQVIITGNPYSELGATAFDSLDGDLSAAIVIDSTGVDTMVVGDYTVTYDVTDAAGNSASTVSRTVSVQNPPGPDVSVTGDIKTLEFTWTESNGAEFYRLLENPDGHSGFSQVGDDIPAGTLSARQAIAVHLFDWTNAQYVVEACNSIGCNSSEVATVSDVMLDTIGYFKASNTDIRDRFGMSVALGAGGEVLVVGVPFEDSGAVGTNGDQHDDMAADAGAAYIFRFDGSAWYQDAYIKASNTGAGDEFGFAVALSADGDTLVVGALGESSSATGINGDQDDNASTGAGAVYVFRYDGLSWHQGAYIKASNTDSGDDFGYSVALSADGKTLVVGAQSEESNATGVDGDQYDNSIYIAGAVYVFRLEGPGWRQQAYVKASNQSRLFGYHIALSADGATLAVGARGESSSATGINGDQDDNASTGAGAVYVFRFNDSVWHQEAYVKASNTDSYDHFGNSITLSDDGNTLAVGAPDEDGSANDIDGDQYDNTVHGSGAVYIFRFEESLWHQQAYIKASNAEVNDWFGSHVSLSADGTTMAVAAMGEDSNATGVGGNQYDNVASRAGAVYLFRLSDSTWYQHAYIKAPNTGPDAWFGRSVWLSADGETMAIGAILEDSGAGGINGDQDDNSAEDSGAVYVY